MKISCMVDCCTVGSTTERRQIWYLDEKRNKVHKNWEAVDELSKGCQFAFFDDLHCAIMLLVIFIIIIKKMLYY